MKLSKLVQLIDGKVLTDNKDDDREIAGAMGADLMSDVLSSIKPESVLLTGLCNPQVVRTALIADIKAIVFIRGKNPAQETINLANEENIPLVTTTRGLYDASGILFQAGLPSFETQTEDDCS
ncbi:MAG: DRTGG domain-containing protein [Brevefilum sp.]